MRNIILALAVSLFAFTGVQAGENPFNASAKTSDSQVAMGKKDGKDKKGSCDGKKSNCGGSKKGSCGGNKKGNCSGTKKGSCGGTKKGSCGGSKKGSCGGSK